MKEVLDEETVKEFAAHNYHIQPLTNGQWSGYRITRMDVCSYMRVSNLHEAGVVLEAIKSFQLSKESA
jgi:hypothetical protein